MNNFGTGLCLVSPDLKKGDAVLIISENSPEWIICEQACMVHGFIVVCSNHDIVDPSKIPTSDIDTARTIIDREKRAHVVVCSTKYSMDILTFIESIEEHSIHTLIQVQESNNTIDVSL